MFIFVTYEGTDLYYIEFWLAHCDVPFSNCWFSDISCQTKTRGITEFLKNKIGEPEFSPEDFSEDSEVLENIREWLFNENDNSALGKYNEAIERHNTVFLPKLKEIFENYCQKYNLSYKIC